MAKRKTSIEELIDEAGALTLELAPIKAKLDRLEHLRRAIRDLAPENKSQIEGAKFCAVLGEPANRTVVDYQELLKRITPQRFAKFATATIAALEEHVPAGHLVHCLTVEPSGPRSLKFTQKAQAE